MSSDIVLAATALAVMTKAPIRADQALGMNCCGGRPTALIRGPNGEAPSGWIVDARPPESDRNRRATWAMSYVHTHIDTATIIFHTLYAQANTSGSHAKEC